MIVMKRAPLLVQIMLNVSDAWAITLPPWGIYYSSEIAFNEEVMARMKRHENCHWEQYERLGAVRYYLTYIGQWVKYGYRDMPMEKEARTRE